MLIFADSCGYLTTTALLQHKYMMSTTVGAHFTAEGPFSQGVLRGSSGTQQDPAIYFSTPGSTFIVQAYIYCYEFGNWDILRFLNVDGNVHTCIRNTSSGTSRVANGGATILGQIPKLYGPTWQYLQMKVYIHDTLGTVELRLNGEVILNLSNVDTRNHTTDANCYGIIFGCSQNLKWSDIIIMDSVDGTATQGAAYNDIIPPVRVSTLPVTGAGNYSQFTPSAGSNYQNVDDASPDSDTTYNESSTVGHIDTFAFTDAPAGAAIKAIQVCSDVRLTDAASRTIRSKWRISAVDYSGTSLYVPPAYNGVREIFGKSPATGNPWGVAEVNSAEVGYELVS